MVTITQQKVAEPGCRQACVQFPSNAASRIYLIAI